MGATNMSNPDFDKNIFITYLDEVESYNLGDYSFMSIVSISMRKSYYKEIIEPRWKKLRKKYGIEDGTCLHFTDIKALLNEDYFTRRDRKLDLENIFCSKGTLDKEKLYSFYTDIIDIINECEFDVLVTGARQDRSDEFYKCKKLLQNRYYTLLKEHLDNLAEYMTFKSDNKKRKIYKTKMIFDGDEGFKEKPHLIRAFSDVICNGTERFNAKHCISCFDNFEFIGKDKVGLGVGESHAGNELLDFVALYIARYYSKDMMINDYMRYKKVSENEAKVEVDRNIKIYNVGTEDIYPHESIEPKIYKYKLI